MGISLVTVRDIEGDEISIPVSSIKGIVVNRYSKAGAAGDDRWSFLLLEGLERANITIDKKEHDRVVALWSEYLDQLKPADLNLLENIKKFDQIVYQQSECLGLMRNQVGKLLSETITTAMQGMTTCMTAAKATYEISSKQSTELSRELQEKINDFSGSMVKLRVAADRVQQIMKLADGESTDL